MDLGAPAQRRPHWPRDLLSVDDLSGIWEPQPFRQFVLKIHSRCNLSCDYCYVYEMADQSWRGRPNRMPTEVVDMTARRIRDHVREHDLDRVRVVLHGGEPLLAGAPAVVYVVETVRRAVGDAAEVDFTVQTNGLLLTEDMLDVLLRHRVRVGVSLDGGARDNDRHRRRADGRGSHAAVVRALARLRAPKYQELYAGLLCAIDLANDPVEVYESLIEHQPPMLDFLLPHGNWTSPPPGRNPSAQETPYGDWLVAAFDRWAAAPTPEPPVRLFRDVLSLLMGGGGNSEQIGTDPAVVVVVDADGSIEQVDTLKSAYDGAGDTGHTVFSASFDEALHHPSVAARQLGVLGLSDKCRSCGIREVCGGGYYPHRYRDDNGFLNPSVYCPDLQRFIEHARSYLTANLRCLTAAGENRGRKS